MTQGFSFHGNPGFIVFIDWYCEVIYKSELMIGVQTMMRPRGKLYIYNDQI